MASHQFEGLIQQAAQSLFRGRQLGGQIEARALDAIACSSLSCLSAPRLSAFPARGAFSVLIQLENRSIGLLVELRGLVQVPRPAWAAARLLMAWRAEAGRRRRQISRCAADGGQGGLPILLG